jgi:hypothetical protein
MFGARPAALRLVISMLVLAFGCPAASLASVSKPENLSVEGQASQPAAAASSSSETAVAWHDQHGGFESALRLARHTAGQPWPTADTLSLPQEAQNGEPSVAVDAHGDTMVAWSGEGDNIDVALAEPGKAPSAPVRVAHDSHGTGPEYPFAAFTSNHHARHTP